MSDRTQATESASLKFNAHISIDLGKEHHDDARDAQNNGRANQSQSQRAEPQKNKDKAAPRLLGIPGHQPQYSGNRSYNYEEKYAPDPLGKEMDENARVWKVYLDEAESYDNEMLGGFRDTLDSLLVFAALFSAVVTSFVIATLSALQPNYNQISAILLLEQVQLLRAAGNITAINATPSSNLTLSTLNSVSPGNSDLWINGLFFASLSLSLTTALLSVLIKQWLQAYSAISSGNAREQALIRQFRFAGLQKWKVPEIIGVLPLILHTSLALFFVGLSLYIAELHESFAWIVVTITILAFTMYVGSIFLPAVWLQCPYRIPLLFVPARSILHFFNPVAWLQDYPSVQSLKESEIESLRWMDVNHIIRADILAWLCTLQSNWSIQRVVAQSFYAILKSKEQEASTFSFIYKPWLEKYLDLLGQTMWNSLIALNHNDIHGLEIWPSVISEWIKNADWPQMEIETIRRSSVRAIAEHGNVVLEKILQIISVHSPGIASKDVLHDWCSIKLHDYSQVGPLDAVKSLVEVGGAEINTKQECNRYGTAFQAAAQGGSLEIVKYLVSKGADVNAQGGEYVTALLAAAYEGHLEIVKYLVSKGADVNTQGGEYGTALQTAAVLNQLEIVKYLVENGAEVNAQGGYYGTVLQAVARWCNLDTIKYLVSKGADVNAQGGEYGTALQAAALKDCLQIVKYLVSKGADVNAQGGRYGTALQAAAYMSHLEIVQYLVSLKGADVNAQGGEYGTALQAAALGGSLEIVKYLVDNGAEVNVQGGEFGTALQAAAWRHDGLDVVKYLVDKGADVNTHGGLYISPLKAALRHGNKDIIQYLRAHDARE